MITLFLKLENTTLARALKELFDPLPAYAWAEEGTCDLVITDLPDLKLPHQLFIQPGALKAQKLIQEIDLRQQNTPRRFGPYQLFISSKELHTPSGVYTLPRKEVELLAVLVENLNETVTRAALMGTVWGYSAEADSHTLETHIYRLRQKLEKDPSQPIHLVSEREGYRLNI